MIRSIFNYLIWRFKNVKNRTHGFSVISDTRIYYEIYGVGTPLLLLHGGLTSVESWFAQLPTLSNDFKLYVIDLRGHGRSTSGTQEFTYELLAKDVVEVLDDLELTKVDILGWSDGGNVGLKLAIDFPQRVRRLIAISANYHPDGLTPKAIKDMKTATPANHSILAKWIYRMIAPDPFGWDILWQRVTTMWANYPQQKRSDLERISAPTLLIQGEHDIISEEHFIEMAVSIPNAETLVIADAGHNVLQQAPDIINTAVKHFLL